MAHSFNNASPTINDLMKKSTEISSGPPAVRRLLTTRSNLDESGKIRKWTFGQQNANMQNKTILMVGETGTGKTTLINTMTNYYLGVKFEDKVWFEITEEKKKDQTESQTSEITLYEIFSEQKPESFTIIDTPGYGDTEGIDKDMEIAQNLYKLFLHDAGVKSLDAVCLVLKSSQNRISERQHYIFDAILSLFGKDIERNVVLFITHTDRLTVDVLEVVEIEKIPCCHNAENEPVHFLFNNIQSEIQTAKNKRTVKWTWEIGQSSMKRFLEFLKSRQRKGLNMSVSVLKERMQIEDCVQSLKEQIEFMEETEKELSEMKNLLKLKKENLEKDNNFHFTLNMVYTEKAAFNTQLCYVMKDDLCTVCKHHSTKHVKQARKHVTKQEDEENTHGLKKEKNVEPEDVKQLEKKGELKDVEMSLKTLLTKNEKKKNILLKDASELIMKLSKTPDSPLTLFYLDFLIPRVEEAGEKEWAQKLKDFQKRKISRSTDPPPHQQFPQAESSPQKLGGLHAATFQGHNRLSDASSALNYLIKKSVELRSGPPAVRRFYTTRSNLDESGKIRKWTFGQKHPNMQNKTILMVGETGKGKTTLINTMTNYYLGVKFEDKVWFEITEEEKRDQTESQTSEITVYEIFSDRTPESLTIIDTPGYGHTEGIEKDMEIPQNLYKLFLHDTGVKYLDAVCLVLKANQNRISDAQRYMFEGVLSLFGKDIEENIVLFITYSDGLTPENVLKAVEKEKIPCCYNEDEPVYFLFNNRQSEKQSTAKTKRAVKMGWEMGEESLEQFFEFLKSQQKKSLTMTKNVLKKRIQLEACVQSLKEHTKFMEAKQRELIEVKLNKEQVRLLSILKDLLAQNEKEKNRLVKEAYETIIKLSEIALKPDSAFTAQHLDFLIPRVEEAGEAEWAQKLKNIQKDAAKESTTSAVEFINRMMVYFSEK